MSQRVLRTALMMVGAISLLAGEQTYVENVEQWRGVREAKLKTDTGWLTVAGLFWLKPGNNAFGSAESNAVVLPRTAPQMGLFRLTEQGVYLEPGPGADLKLNGKPAKAGLLRSDKSGSPDLLTTGKLTFFVIQRGPRYAIRLRDLESQYRREFTRLNWYPVDERYKVIGTFEPYRTKKDVKIDTIIGIPDGMVAPGTVLFELKGKSYRLEPVEDEGSLWFIFRDGTTGHTTYGGGRFLYADMPKNGKVTLDFNQAYNPPCVFTPYATCPLPPSQNRLTVPIEAGEKRYGNH